MLILLMLSVKYITQVYPHWLPCHYPSSILHSQFQIAQVHAAQHSFEIWHSYRDVPEDLGLPEGVALSSYERFPNILMENSTFIFKGQAVHEAQHFKRAMTLCNTWYHSPNNSVTPQRTWILYNILNATTVLQITSKQDSWNWKEARKHN